MESNCVVKTGTTNSADRNTLFLSSGYGCLVCVWSTHDECFVCRVHYVCGYVCMQLVGKASTYVRICQRAIVSLGEGQRSSGAKRGLRTKPERDTRLHEITVPSQGIERVTCPPQLGHTLFVL